MWWISIYILLWGILEKGGLVYTNFCLDLVIMTFYFLSWQRLVFWVVVGWTYFSYIPFFLLFLRCSCFFFLFFFMRSHMSWESMLCLYFSLLNGVLSVWLLFLGLPYYIYCFYIIFCAFFKSNDGLVYNVYF